MASILAMFEGEKPAARASADAPGRRHGLTQDAGFLLGGDEASISDVVTATLWSTMADRFPRIAALLSETAPLTAALSARIAAMPPRLELAARVRRD